jgi:outer membrane receptor protein involved in Fe transport
LIEPVQAERDSNNAGTQLFTYANIGKAHTAGLNASLRAQKLLWGLNVKANYSYLPLSERLPSGTPLNLRANHSGRFEISRHWLDESLETWTDIEGRSEMSVPDNSPGAPAYATFGAGLEYQITDQPQANIQLDADNLLDQTNATWGPKPGRTIFARLSLDYSTK